MTIINNYKLIKKIGKGSYGEVWKARHIYRQKDVAIKVETKGKKNTLKIEIMLLRYLSNIAEIPYVKFYGESDTFTYIILELLGSSISDYYFNLGEKNINELKWIGLKMLSSIHDIHHYGIIHRDIKPDNFLLTTNNKNVKIIDFGLAKHYIDCDGKHKECVKHNNIIGTPRYISLYVHEKNSPSRRDDLISFVYVLLFLMNYSVPWQYVKGDSREEKINNVYIVKKGLTNNQLCSNINYENLSIDENLKIREKMEEILNYVYSLTYDETPNYEYVRFLLKTII